jgi:hypothetical protein
MCSYLTDENKLDNLQNHVYKSQQRAENVKKSNELKFRVLSSSFERTNVWLLSPFVEQWERRKLLQIGVRKKSSLTSNKFSKFKCELTWQF